MVEQHTGEDKIKTQLKEKQHFLLNQHYTGQNNQLLEKFINQHRTAYTRLEECAKRVDLQASKHKIFVGQFEVQNEVYFTRTENCVVENHIVIKSQQ